MNENSHFTEVCPKGPNDNKSSLVQVKAWDQNDEKPFSEPMMTQFTEAYIQHLGEMS